METLTAIILWMLYTGHVHCDSKCFDIMNRESYQGTISVTRKGQTCQPWASQSPHKHKYTPGKFPFSGLAGNNYCRNPDKDWRGPWCYVMDKTVRWEYCDIPKCAAPTTEKPTTTTKPVTLSPSTECGKPTIPMFDDTKGFGFQRNLPLYIVGGTTATQGSIPWQVSIRITGHTRHLCGGSLLNQNWILSAAHCIDYPHLPKRYFAILGDYDQDEREFSELRVGFSQIFNHEGYNFDTIANDITLIKMDRTISYTNYIQPVCLPPANAIPESKSKVVVSGWGDTKGTTQDAKLNRVTLPVVDVNLCKIIYRKVDDTPPILSTNLCTGYHAGGKGACYGDSGGAVVQKSQSGTWQVVGVVSWGKGCAERRRPTVHTLVSKYIDWIESKMNSNNFQPLLRMYAY